MYGNLQLANQDHPYLVSPACLLSICVKSSLPPASHISTLIISQEPCFSTYRKLHLRGSISGICFLKRPKVKDPVCQVRLTNSMTKPYCAGSPQQSLAGRRNHRPKAHSGLSRFQYTAEMPS